MQRSNLGTVDRFESTVDALLPRGAMNEAKRLVTGLVHHTLRRERGVKSVLAGAEGRVDPGVSALRSDVVNIVLDDVPESADVGVLNLGWYRLMLLYKSTFTTVYSHSSAKPRTEP